MNYSRTSSKSPFAIMRWWPRLIVVLGCALFAAPLFLMFSGALRAPGMPPPTSFEWWPAEPTFQAFADAFRLVPLAGALLNSLWVTIIAVPLTLIVASSAGFAMTQLPQRQQLFWLSLLLLAASIPLTAVLIPRFILFHALGLSTGYVPLIAPALTGGSPLFVLLFFAAMQRVPADLIESARLEGMGLARIWWRVALPLVRPTTFAVGMLAGVLFWGNFMEALLYLKAEHQLTAPLMLHALDLLGATQWPVLLAGSVAVTFPVVLVFVLLQGYLTNRERGGTWFVR